MARIVYGVSGEGSGHSSRAREMLRHLLAAGHEVRVATYDRGVRNLSDDFDVFPIEGLTIASVENRVSLRRTFAENFARLGAGFRRVRDAQRELFEAFEPHVVITDFEPVSAYLAHHVGRPLISLDNQHRMRWMRYPCPDALRSDARLTETVIRALVPRPDVALVTTFWYGAVKNDVTFLFPPILRREVLTAKSSDDGHVLVYFTGGFDSFLEHLRAAPDERFVVYGSGSEGRDGNLHFRAPSREGFLADLASAKAVVATAGFTLMTEALHLGKPVLALPMAGQFEQELNALLLEDGGWGRNGRDATRDTLGDFLYRLPAYRARLADYPVEDNARILAKLDELLADDAREARRYRALRKGQALDAAD